ncbi:RusA family crossover junction endodeoxyribonuclease [Alkalihalophilus pseudofirmus]|uniref:RusA family crossover junction endodeoxyribonuclease n=1 Tax=Alkalihalophilus pseudofirmus TaxID=79885 RepID=UPI00259B637F|nr:RusA family crossover junction endodeoxyribonuclease [Alkalihalophilus pseudofirmus]WEG18693.1 RusA family crossover junction endodeoxyribonuclease [Alkalihalophilus pseudofirmus]
MSKELKLILDLPTSINKLYVNQHSWNPKTRTRVPTGKRVMSSEGRKVKEKIAKQAKEQIKGQDWDFDYTRDHYIYQDSVMYMSRSNRDDNNVYKLLNDTLEGICYENDSRVLTRTQRIYIDPKDPHIEVTLTPVPYIGIFDNEQQLHNFEENCKTCTRYKRNCSILNKAKEGRIQEDLDEKSLVCSKYKEVKK